MPPKRCCPVASDLTEEAGRNVFNLLNEMLAYKEAAFDESRAAHATLSAMNTAHIIGHLGPINGPISWARALLLISRLVNDIEASGKVMFDSTPANAS